MNVRARQSACAALPTVRFSHEPPDVMEFVPSRTWLAAQRKWQQMRRLSFQIWRDLGCCAAEERRESALDLAKPRRSGRVDAWEEWCEQERRRDNLLGKARRLEEDVWAEDVCRGRQPAREDPRRPQSASPSRMRYIRYMQLLG